MHIVHKTLMKRVDWPHKVSQLFSLHHVLFASLTQTTDSDIEQKISSNCCFIHFLKTRNFKKPYSSRAPHLPENLIHKKTGRSFFTVLMFWSEWKKKKEKKGKGRRKTSVTDCLEKLTFVEIIKFTLRMILYFSSLP